jgi:hypothetical protein
MQAKQEIINTIEILPQNIVEEVCNYMLYLKAKTEKEQEPEFKVTRETFFGCMKGEIWESDDHDWFEPMKEFEDYM